MSIVLDNPPPVAIGAATGPTRWTYLGHEIVPKSNEILDRVCKAINTMIRVEDVESMDLPSFDLYLRGCLKDQGKVPFSPKEPECAICRIPLDVNQKGPPKDHHQHVPVKTLECGHDFGWSCLFKWWMEILNPQCPFCQKSLIGPISEPRFNSLRLPDAFKCLEQGSNGWSLEDIERTATVPSCHLDSKEWIQELTKIYAAVLWSPYIRKSEYRAKASLLIWKLREERTIDLFGKKESRSIRDALMWQYEELERQGGWELVDVQLLRGLSSEIYEY